MGQDDSAAGRAALRAGDVLSWLCSMSSHHYLDAFMGNFEDLRGRGLLEEAWVQVYQSGRPSSVARAVSALVFLLEPARLRAAGAPIPSGPLTLYRGVCGRGRARNVRGLSWTATLDCARWFAGRGAYSGAGQPDPAVFRLVVPSADVLCHLDDRSEDEYLVRPEPGHQPERIERVSEETFRAVVERWRKARP